MEELSNAATEAANWLSQLANSSIFITLASAFTTALAGAFAGAYGAQLIAERKESRRRLLEEIRNTNAAIIVAFSITNAYCMVKGQHVKNLKENFDKQRKALDISEQKFQQGLIRAGHSFEFEMDFQIIPLVPVPIQRLQNLVFEKISVVGGSLALVTVLSQCIDGVNEAIMSRNGFIATYKEKLEISEDKRVSIYFGRPDENGHIDSTYPDLMVAIASQTDDCIFFGKLLSENLTKHGETLAKRFGRRSPRIHKINFATAEQEGLIPDSKQYTNWVNMLKAEPSSERAAG